MSAGASNQYTHFIGQMTAVLQTRRARRAGRRTALPHRGLEPKRVRFATVDVGVFSRNASDFREVFDAHLVCIAFREFAFSCAVMQRAQ
jgi:hypothetical protein